MSIYRYMTMYVGLTPNKLVAVFMVMMEQVTQVHHISPDRNISTTIRWTATTFMVPRGILMTSVVPCIFLYHHHEADIFGFQWHEFIPFFFYYQCVNRL